MRDLKTLIVTKYGEPPQTWNTDAYKRVDVTCDADWVTVELTRHDNTLTVINVPADNVSEIRSVYEPIPPPDGKGEVVPLKPTISLADIPSPIYVNDPHPWW